jgi:ABC-type bacteriocin/lantibiotic exporter with double-glycine peptidase domain
MLGAFLIIEGEFNPGRAGAFLALVPRLHGGITSLLQTNIQYKKQLGEFHTLIEYLEMSREKGGDLQPAAFLQHDLRVEHVSFRYGDSAKGADKALLSGVSLDVEGKMDRIEGESGIGKST